MTEIWKIYKDTTVMRDGRSCKWGAKWEISNTGLIKKNGELFAPRINSGYCVFANNVFLHKAVAELFIPNDDITKKQVDHIDTNKLNNNVTNLRWVTRTENMNNILSKIHMSVSAKNVSHKHGRHFYNNGIEDKVLYKEEYESIYKMLGFVKGRLPMTEEQKVKVSNGLKKWYKENPMSQLQKDKISFSHKNRHN